MDNEKKTVKDLRAVLKNCIHDEFKKLPETLKEMEPKDRLNALSKLLPYALPKSGKVKATFGESF